MKTHVLYSEFWVKSFSPHFIVRKLAIQNDKPCALWKSSSLQITIFERYSGTANHLQTGDVRIYEMIKPDHANSHHLWISKKWWSNQFQFSIQTQTQAELNFFCQLNVYKVVAPGYNSVEFHATDCSS